VENEWYNSHLGPQIFFLFQSFRIDFWVHLAFYSVCTWSCLEQGARRPERQAGHSPPLDPEVKLTGSLAPVPHATHRDNSSLTSGQERSCR